MINSSGIAEFEPLLFNENSGSATFNASGALSIVGTGAISTSGTGNTVTIAFGSSGSSPGDVLVINSSGIASSNHFSLMRTLARLLSTPLDP